MKRKLLVILPLTVISGIVVGGCISTHRTEVLQPTSRTVETTEPVTTTTTRTVVVSSEPPPAPRAEVMGAPPTETDVWVSGNWDSVDGKWTWLPSHWEERPRTGAVWVSGHWDENMLSRNWVWTPGYWE
jgi:hypothetical protein